MDDNLTPTQRKRQRLDVRKAAQNSPPPNAKSPAPPPDEAAISPEQLWEKWEREPATPQQLEAIARDRAALIQEQQIHPDTGHVFARTPTSTTPEELEKYRQKLQAALEKHRQEKQANS